MPILEQNDNAFVQSDQNFYITCCSHPWPILLLEKSCLLNSLPALALMCLTWRWAFSQAFALWLLWAESSADMQTHQEAAESPLKRGKGGSPVLGLRDVLAERVAAKDNVTRQRHKGTKHDEVIPSYLYI